MRTIIDANMVLRYLLDDNEIQAELAEDVIVRGAYLPNEIIAEAVYVLQKVYKIDRLTIATLLSELFEIVAVDDRETVVYALNKYASLNLDFADCLLIAYNRVQGRGVFTFDKKIKEQIGGRLAAAMK